MILTRSCCDPCPAQISKMLTGEVMIYCPICGFTMYGHSRDEAIELWKKKMDGKHHNSLQKR